MPFDSTQVAQPSRSRGKGIAAFAQLQVRQRVTTIGHGVCARTRVQEVMMSRVLEPSAYVRESLGVVLYLRHLATEGRA